jgi:hypothetical protein
MAASIVLGYRGANGAPVPRAAVNSAEYIADTSVESQSSITASERFEYWFITPTTDVWVAFGTDPTASPGVDWLVIAGTTRDFEAQRDQKVSIVDA